MSVKIETILKFINDDKFYLGYGGIGDLWLSLSTCYNAVNPRLVFWSTNSFSDIVKRISESMKINVLVVPFGANTPYSRFIWETCHRHKNLAAKPIFPSTLSLLKEWESNTELNLSRIGDSIPLKEIFGTVQKTDKMVCMAPVGSCKSRMLDKNEFSKLVESYISNKWRVFSVAAASQIDYYEEDRCEWLNTDFIKHGEKTISIDITTMFKIINSCDLIVSLDTWLKTYTCLAGIPTKVIMNKRHKKYYFDNNGSDRIFLNLEKWKSMSLVTLDEAMDFAK
jgi:hypothetical protein